MNLKHRPLVVTVLFGLVGALGVFPLSILSGLLNVGPLNLRLIVWVYFVCYAWMLAKWGRKQVVSIGFPSLLVLVCAVLADSTNTFLLLTLAAFCWVRSGICFRKSKALGLAAELLLGLGGAALVAGLDLQGRLSWAAGVWIFFLVQSLYFVFVSPEREPEGAAVPTDPFDQARRRMENVLSPDR